MYFTVAQDGTVLSVNRFGAKQLGFTIEELVGQSVWNIVHEEDRQEVQEKFAQCMKTPTLVRHWEFRKVCKNGQVMWVKEVVKVVQGRDENVLVLMVCEDITDRKRTEEALRESEGRFRSVAQSANDAIISADDQGLIISWNNGAHTMFGYEEQEVMGKSLTVLMPKRYRDAHRQGLKRVQVTGKSTLKGRTIELYGLRKNTTEFPMELVISSWVLSGKSYFTGIIRDITDRKRVEEALKEAHDSLERRVVVRTKELGEANQRLRTEIWERQRTEEDLRISEERFRDLYESAPLAYLSAATDGIIWKANAQASELFGYSHKELIGRHVLDLYAPTADGKEKARQLIIEGGEIVGEELEAQRADGTILWIDLTVRFIRNAQGRPLERRAILKDITERRRMAEQIRQYTEELERMVAERTDQIRKLEAQRMQSEKLAALGQLAAGVAHEINNPLAGVSNGFLLIKEAIPTEHPMYPYVDIVDQGLTRVTEIVENMYKLYGGGLKEGWLMPADRVVKDVLQMLAKQMKEREISVIKEIPAGLPDVLIREIDLAQVLTNLLQNAIDASPNGGTIRVTVKPVGHTMRIEVADEGVGISPEVVSRIFEPFFTTKTGGPKSSMGLGLSVSNSLVEAMGGRIEVESRMGEGTTFIVVLPLEQKENHSE
jgi:PAS domain S-box-containing protein